MKRTLRIYSLNNFHMWHTVVLIIFMFYSIPPVLLFLINGSLHLLTAFIQLASPPLVTTNLISSTYVCLFLKCNWTIALWTFLLIRESMFLCISQWSPCKSSYNISPKILHSYWLYSPQCSFHTHNSFISQMEICTSQSLSPRSFLQSPPLLETNCLLKIYFLNV